MPGKLTFLEENLSLSSWCYCFGLHSGLCSSNHKPVKHVVPLINPRIVEVVFCLWESHPTEKALLWDYLHFGEEQGKMGFAGRNYAKLSANEQYTLT